MDKVQFKQMKPKQALQLEAVKAILNGELLVEEAMAKYNVKDKRTMTAWIKKTIPLLDASRTTNRSRSEASSNSDGHVRQGHKHEIYHQQITTENALLKKIIALQDQVRELEEKNVLLKHHRDRLLQKISSLELRGKTHQKEPEYLATHEHDLKVFT